MLSDSNSNSICRIELNLGEKIRDGTGFWIIAPCTGVDCIMTNNHVLHDAPEAAKAKLFFGHRDDLKNTGILCTLNPEKLFHTNAKLDYTIVAIGDASVQRLKGNHWRPFELCANIPDPNDSVRIMGHPGGRPLTLACATIKDVDKESCSYTFDTESGMSGAPVFDDSNKVVLLHYGGNKSANHGKIITNIISDFEIGYKQPKSAKDEIVHEAGLRRPGGKGRLIEDSDLNAICRIEFTQGRHKTDATGFWIIAPGTDVNCIMTNNHVLKDENEAATAKLYFGHRDNEKGIECTLNREFFWSSEKFDYTIVAIDDGSVQRLKDAQWRPLELGNNIPPAQETVQIWGHPYGEPLKHAFGKINDINTKFSYSTYKFDTEPGMSGAPVVDTSNYVVLLHSDGSMSGNCGYHMKKISSDLESCVQRARTKPVTPREKEMFKYLNNSKRNKEHHRHLVDLHPPPSS